MKIKFMKLLLLVSIIMFGYCCYSQKKPSYKIYNISDALQINSQTDTVMGQYDIFPYRAMLSDRKFKLINYNNEDTEYLIMTKPRVTTEKIRGGLLYKTYFYVGDPEEDIETYKKVLICRFTGKNPQTIIYFYIDVDDTDGYHTHIAYIIE